jgi:hypothetical protein
VFIGSSRPSHLGKVQEGKQHTGNKEAQENPRTETKAKENMYDSRKEFEKWIKSKKLSTERYPMDVSEYEEMEVQVAWELWCKLKPEQKFIDATVMALWHVSGESFTDCCEDSSFGNRLLNWLHKQKKRITTKPKN